MSPIGMCFAPSKREASYSQGSRTSTRVKVSPRSCIDFTWPGEISKSIVSSICAVILSEAKRPRHHEKTQLRRSFVLFTMTTSVIPAALRRASQSGQTHQRRQRPECAGCNAGRVHVRRGDAMPERQSESHDKIGDQHSKK